jgi:hypothetical protein
LHNFTVIIIQETICLDNILAVKKFDSKFSSF